MICKLMEWMISNAQDSGNDYPPIVKRHMARCTDCRAFADLSDTVATRLTADAKRVASPLVTKDSVGSTPGLSLCSRPAIALVAACVLCAVGLWIGNHRPSTCSDDGSVEFFVSTLPTPGDLLRSAAIDSVLPEEPYSRELTALVDDTTSALNSIAACAGLDSELLATIIN